MSKFPIPSNIKRVPEFLGMAGYYRGFVKGFSKITKPLKNLTEDDVSYV